MIKGAQSKKNLISPYFQPLSHIQIIYNENEKRELQIVSKVNFVDIWLKISSSLKKMTLLQSILEITDFTLEKNDPHPILFTILIDVVSYIKRPSAMPTVFLYNPIFSVSLDVIAILIHHRYVVSAQSKCPFHLCFEIFHHVLGDLSTRCLGFLLELIEGPFAGIAVRH